MAGIGLGCTMSLRGSYGGAAAAAAWSPADLPDLELWLPNSFLATIGDAQPIAQWDDASGFDRHAVQATGTNQPTARLTGDKWEAKGDGVDDTLVSTFGATIAQPTTVWCVGSVETTSAAGRYLFDDPVTDDSQTMLRRTTDFRMYAGTAIDRIDHDAAVHAFVLIFNGASSKFRIDGVESAGNAGTRATVGRKLFTRRNPIAGQHNDGVIRDLGLCSGVLAGADLTNLETYLAGLV